MRDVAPAIGTLGLILGFWVLYAVVRLVTVGGFLVGSPALVVWQVEPRLEGSWAIEVGGAVLLAALMPIGALFATRLPASFALGGLAIGILGMLGWVGAMAVSAVSATTGITSLFFVAGDPLSWWPAWAYWIFDLGALTAAAVLLASGRGRGRLGRRAVLAGILAVMVDAAWRGLFAITSGRVPWLLDPNTGIVGQHLLWVLSIGLAVAFVAVFSSLPDRPGPSVRGLVLLLGLAGLWLGVQASCLLTVGTLDALGMDGRLLFPIPTEALLLGLLRLGLVAAGLGSLGLRQLIERR